MRLEENIFNIVEIGITVGEVLLLNSLPESLKVDLDMKKALDWFIDRMTIQGSPSDHISLNYFALKDRTFSIYRNASIIVRFRQRFPSKAGDFLVILYRLATVLLLQRHNKNKF